MKARTATAGATLIIVMLLTLLMLAVVLAASMRLGLASRQNTADQKAILQAQFAAESGINLSRSRLNDIQDMLSNSSARIAGGAGLRISRTTRASAVEGWVTKLCGTSPWDVIYEGKKPGDKGFFDPGVDPDSANDDVLYPSAKACQPAGLSEANFELFAKIVTDAAYKILPLNEQPALNDTAKQAYWYTVLTSKVKKTSSLASSEISPRVVRILKLSSSHFRIFVQSDGATGASLNESLYRKVDGRPTRISTWWFDVNKPELNDAVVQTDIHTTMPTATQPGARVNFTTATNFEGPVKTNDVFTFQSNDLFDSPSFTGQLSSAGCIDRLETAEDITCNRNPGVVVDDSIKRDFSGTTDSAKSNAIKNHLFTKGVRINYNGLTPDFASQYQPFPEIALIQANAAAGKDEDGATLPGGSRGLTLSSTQIGVQMFAGDVNGNALDGYDTTNRKWNEPSPVYQYIKPITTENCTTAIDVNGCTYTFDTTIYRVDKDGNMQQKVGKAGWETIAGAKFNGVIYKTGDITVVGPQPGRTTGSTPEAQARPALASFSGMTLATTGTMKLRSDLANSQTPCRFSEYDTVTVDPPCSQRTNVLGLFSSAKSIIVGKQAPNDVVIQTAMMSSQEEFTVEDYKVGASRGSMRFTGSLVEKYYGANGTFGTETKRECAKSEWWGCSKYVNITTEVRTGYMRDYTYDKRFSEGLLPPYYPTSPKWTLTDARNRGNDLSDVIWNQGKK